MRPIRRGRVTAAVLWLVASTFAAPDSTAGPRCPGVLDQGAWEHIRMPNPRAAAEIDRRPGDFGGGEVRTAVDPGTPSRLFASNGATVVRSTDGGCTWKTVFDLGDSPATPSQERLPWT